MASCSAAFVLTLKKSLLFSLTLLALLAVGCASAPTSWPPPDIVEPSYHTVTEPASVWPHKDSAFLVGSVLAHEEAAILPGANVWTSDGAFQTTTDSLGQFRLALRPGTYVVQVQFLGYNGVTTDSLTFPASSVRESRFELGNVIIIE